MPIKQDIEFRERDQSFNTDDGTAKINDDYSGAAAKIPTNDDIFNRLGDFIGPAGPAGPQGPVGPAGPPGPTGSIGPQGPIGLQGLQGLAGATGPQGVQGLSGVPGSAGSVGPQGIQGLQGIPGPTGSIGPSGSVGPQGTQGLQGPIGLSGAKGDPGPTGSQGPQGLQGPQGVQGIPGTAAAKGDPGPTGSQGPQGLTGPQGIQGLKGDPGPTGSAGAAGAQGVQGPAGPQGIQGIQGLVGPSGAIGPTGLTGPRGDKGDAGTNGNTILNGTGVPANTLGNDKDLYIDLATITSTYNIYGPKVSGSWGNAIALRVSGSIIVTGSGGTNTGSGGTTGSVATGSLVYIFQSGDKNGWQENSYSGLYGTTIDSRTGGLARSGSLSQYGAIYYYNTSKLINNYMGFQFDAISATGTPTVRVQLDAGSVTNPIIYANKTLSTAWTTYTVMYTGSGVTNNSAPATPFSGFEIVNLAGATTPAITYNNIALITNPNSGSATSGSASTGSSTGSSGGGTGSSGTGGGGVQASGTYAIYLSGVLYNGWQNNNNYGGNFAYVPDSRNIANTCLKQTLNQYGGMNFGSLNNSNIDLNQFFGFSFDAYADSPVQIRFQIDGGNNGDPTVAKDITLGTTWQSYSVYTTGSGVINNSTAVSQFTNVHSVWFGQATAPSFYVNNICMINNPNPPTASYTVVPTDPAPASASAGWLYTKGNGWYVSGSNARWMGRGVNIPDTRLDGKSFYNTQTGVVPEWIRRFNFARSQGVNFFRFLLDMRSTADDPVYNSDYLNAMKQCINYIGSTGAWVMISFWNDYTCQPFGSGQSGQPTILSLTHMTQIVTSFRNCGHVLFGLCNEPRGNDTAAKLATYSQITNKAIEVIRQVEQRDQCKPHIIVVQGPTNWSRQPSYFVTTPAVDPVYPITNSTTVGYIGYEMHNYEMASRWSDNTLTDWQHPAQNIPLLLGEFAPNGKGGDMPDSDVAPCMQYCETNKIPYLAWTFDYNSPPDMIIDNSSTGTGGYGINMTLQWTSFGLNYINTLRAAIGSGSVNSLGQ